MIEPINIAVLGSTGSIGTQTLDIIAEYPERFRAYLLAAGSNWELLVRQALAFRPRCVVLADERYLPQVREALASTAIEVTGGSDTAALCTLMTDEAISIVVGGMVGFAGLTPVISALQSGKTVALANKETLVAAGGVIAKVLRNSGAGHIIPVDSEHSAIYQCLVGETDNPIHRILLTASGGPFRTFTGKELERVTPADALAHPNWTMGAKVTIDSASMMNKGLEMIEARWLFDCEPERIEVLVHPQSVVHSAVEFADGSVKAQMGLPDMHLPIRYALGYPQRLPATGKRLSLTEYGSLTFEAPDVDRFPLLGLAYEAIRCGGTAPCVMNAANEIAVREFLGGRISFVQIPQVVEYALTRVKKVSDPELHDIMDADKAGRLAAQQIIDTFRS